MGQPIAGNSPPIIFHFQDYFASFLVALDLNRSFALHGLGRVAEQIGKNRAHLLWATLQRWKRSQIQFDFGFALELGLEESNRARPQLVQVNHLLLGPVEVGQMFHSLDGRHQPSAGLSRRGRGTRDHLFELYQLIRLALEPLIGRKQSVEGAGKGSHG